MILEDSERAMDALFASFDSTHAETRRRALEHRAGEPGEPGDNPDRYKHLVEEDVHPYQGLCGWEWDGRSDRPEPADICPVCLDIYNGISDPKEIVQ